MTFSVEDDAGEVLATGQDLDALREQVRPRLRAARDGPPGAGTGCRRPGPIL